MVHLPLPMFDYPLVNVYITMENYLAIGKLTSSTGQFSLQEGNDLCSHLSRECLVAGVFVWLTDQLGCNSCLEVCALDKREKLQTVAVGLLGPLPQIMC